MGNNEFEGMWDGALWSSFKASQYYPEDGEAMVCTIHPVTKIKLLLKPPSHLVSFVYYLVNHIVQLQNHESNAERLHAMFFLGLCK
jgi:hypothetical protein